MQFDVIAKWLTVNMLLIIVFSLQLLTTENAIIINTKRDSETKNTTRRWRPGNGRAAGRNFHK